MIRFSVTAAALAMALSPLAVQAAEKTVVLNVDNATCELCAPIVKKTLSRVKGVTAVSLRRRTPATPHTSRTDAIAEKLEE